jgi:hypothetical protein
MFFNLKNCWFYLLLASSLHACSWFGDPSPSLPPETQEGKNTFACLVNGKLWVAEFGSKDIFNTQKTEAQYDPFRQGRVSIRATNDKRETINILIPEIPVNLKMYRATLDTLSQNTALMLPSISSINLKCSGTQIGSYYTGYTLIKKFDLQKRIIAGSFELVIKSAACQDTLKITQGRFDMTF